MNWSTYSYFPQLWLLVTPFTSYVIFTELGPFSHLCVCWDYFISLIASKIYRIDQSNYHREATNYLMILMLNINSYLFHIRTITEFGMSWNCFTVNDEPHKCSLVVAWKYLRRSNEVILTMAFKIIYLTSRELIVNDRKSHYKHKKRNCCTVGFC